MEQDLLIARTSQMHTKKVEMRAKGTKRASTEDIEKLRRHTLVDHNFGASEGFDPLQAAQRLAQNSGEFGGALTADAANIDDIEDLLPPISKSR